ncbi:restriction endonuclease subunit S [Levilactobacillus brevis]|uniref:restriction endonuclease subunit S n=1 Tax=Levilactobacillus brevis TaxID=1580 RepID=UPI0025A4EF95|nr:restriction endonuclease subunit S [Levilactobacillus brevis]MDM5047552.1 restriction endonuclease subunit S [Levilactobacillus brevis]
MKDNQAKYPQLRFKGFTDPWEQRKLGEIAIRVRGNDGRMNLPTLTISAGNGWMDQRDRFSQNIAGKEQKNYTLLRQGELSYNHGNSKLAQFGAVFELESYNEALVPRVYHSFSVTAGAQPKFIEQMFATHRPDRELRKLVSSGARMDGLLNINYDDFMGIKVWLPSVAEQQAIAGLLVKLDNTIALHQRKLAKLKELKQGYLQKMFPKNGSKFPQLRFAGFADAWEQRKLGAITDSFSGGTPTAGKAEYYGGEIPFIRSGEISSDSTELFITDAGLNNSSAKMVGIGDILYALYGATSGETSISRINGAINQAILAIRPTKGDDPYMIVQWLKKQKETIISTYLQGGQGNLSGSIVKDLLITLPKNKDEQAKVGSFFKQLDQTITLHQRKLEKLQELKKGYLKRCFADS